MKVVNVDDVLKILYKYGRYIFVTDEKTYSSMVDEIANLEELKQECDLWETYRNRCKILEEELSKRTTEYYAELDKQATEIALLKSIIEDKGGFHKLHEHVREEDNQG